MNLIKTIFLLIVLFIQNINAGGRVFISDKTKEITQDSLTDKNLNNLFSNKTLGVIVEDRKTIFRLFTPNAENVEVVTYSDIDAREGSIHPMNKDNNGVWETEVEGELYGQFYSFRVKHDNGEPVYCLDPYAKAVATYNTYFSPRRGIIINTSDYNWENDEWIKQDWRDLIIYEMHIKDLTAHPSSGSSKPGTYKGLVEKGQTGGIEYIKSLGVNTVELLPAQDFANIEIPFKDSIKGRYNTWNPYERNYWGYMTGAFFAPDEYYVDNNFELNKWHGQSARQVNDFKDMVKAFHKEGIAVIMDVVYNHISEYEFGNLKEIDKEYYFRLNEKGNYIAESGCGNDLKTERPMMRRMIVESILYWMKEYHIDGFRFDLGKLIDWETVEEIIREAKKINPSVIIVCEPWGGGYDPQGFSLRGWGAWNDQIRNGIKGENPVNGHGWIFGKWYGNNDPDRIKSYVNGTLIKDKHGLFQRKEHSVNYLESHDGYTLGDFIRLGTKEVEIDEVINNIDAHVKLSPLQLKLNKLGALFLFTSQGLTMIHEGQEFARSKVIPLNIKEADEHKGSIDHNSYNKDNESNYLNFDHAQINKELLDYYKGLIQLRKKYEAFRRAEYSDVYFLEVHGNHFAAGYKLNYKDDQFLIAFNASPDIEQNLILDEGEWDVLANEHTAGIKVIKTVKEKIVLGPSTGVVLKRSK